MAPARDTAAAAEPPGPFGDDQRAARVGACVARILALIEQEPDLSLTEIATRLKRARERVATAG